MAGYELNYEALDDADKKKETTAAEEFIDWVETIIGAFFAVIIIFTFLLRVANVDGASMQPTLTEGDRLIVSHLFYEPKVIIKPLHGENSFAEMLCKSQKLIKSLSLK